MMLNIAVSFAQFEKELIANCQGGYGARQARREARRSPRVLNDHLEREGDFAEAGSRPEPARRLIPPRFGGTSAPSTGSPPGRPRQECFRGAQKPR